MANTLQQQAVHRATTLIESRIQALQNKHMDYIHALQENDTNDKEYLESLTDGEWREVERLATIAAELNKSEAHRRIAEFVENLPVHSLNPSNINVVLDFPYTLLSRVQSVLDALLMRI